MASAKVDIANLSLLHIGADKITALTDSNTRAVVCNEFIDQSREEVLVMTRHGWNCAKKRVTIAGDNAEPPFDFDYKYRIPSDCKRVLFPSDEDGSPLTTPWERIGDYVYSDDDECHLVYIYDLDNVSKMSPLLVRAWSLQLAISISTRIKQSTRLKNDLRRDMATTILLAEGTEASEKYVKNPDDVRRTSKEVWVDVT